MTPAMLRALMKAASRERHNICPIRGVWANAETMLIDAMDKRGFIAWDGGGKQVGDYITRGVPRISEAGLRAIGQ